MCCEEGERGKKLTEKGKQGPDTFLRSVGLVLRVVRELLKSFLPFVLWSYYPEHCGNGLRQEGLEAGRPVSELLN